MSRLGCGFTFHVPTWKDQYRWVYLERSSQNLCALDPQVNPIALDCGDCGLRDASESGKIILTEFLQFADDPNGLSYAHLDTPLCLVVVAHIHFFL